MSAWWRTGVRLTGGPSARSWVNRLMGWFDRLPGPRWVAYVFALSLGAAFGAVVAQVIGGASALSPAESIYYGILPVAMLVIIHDLDVSATEAFDRMRPILDMTDIEQVEYRRRLAVIPPLPVLLLTFVSIVLIPAGDLSDPAGSGIDQLSPVGVGVRFIWEAFTATLFLVFILHTVRQLNLVSEVHDRVGQIDVFDQRRLRAFSRVTSRTAFGFIALMLPSVLLIPTDATAEFLLITLGWYAAAIVVSVAAFVLPMLGLHRRLSEERDRLQSEVGSRLSATLEALHVAVDQREGAPIGQSHQALNALLAERALIESIPTWPWNRATAGRLTSAIVLPVGVWIVTHLLDRVV
jgi:hypothetical protein